MVLGPGSKSGLRGIHGAVHLDNMHASEEGRSWSGLPVIARAPVSSPYTAVPVELRRYEGCVVLWLRRRDLMNKNARLRSSALLALTKLMAVDAAFCEANLRLLFTQLDPKRKCASIAGIGTSGKEISMAEFHAVYSGCGGTLQRSSCAGVMQVPIFKAATIQPRD